MSVPTSTSQPTRKCRNKSQMEETCRNTPSPTKPGDLHHDTRTPLPRPSCPDEIAKPSRHHRRDAAFLTKPNDGKINTFELLNESFDTLSEPDENLSPGIHDETFSLSDPIMSPLHPSNSGMEVSIRRKFTIALPQLKPSTDEYDDGQSQESGLMGNISPIKVVYGEPEGVHALRASPNNTDSVACSHLHSQVAVPRAPAHSITSYYAGQAPIPWNHQEYYYQRQYSYLAETTGNPYQVIRSVRQLILSFKYSLPCVQDPSTVTTREYRHPPLRQYRPPILSDKDIAVGTRRVEAAVCAFGGTIIPRNPYTRAFASANRIRYERQFPNRFTQKGSRISWDVEDDPPVPAAYDLDSSTPNDRRVRIVSDMDSTIPGRPTYPANRGTEDNNDTNSDATSTVGNCASSPGSGDDGSKEDSSKLKYRCKLCGQPKQNHSCPYRPSLQRSIGVMVYPAINSYTADEPGRIAPPLTKMNNFVSYDSDQGSYDRDYCRSFQLQSRSHPNAVTPESLHGTGNHFHSPQSTLSAHSDDSHFQPSRHLELAQVENVLGKRSYDSLLHGRETNHSLFVASVSLRPEHYRSISTMERTTAYSYPPVPLGYTERRRLSDTLFCLSRGLPTLSRDCAILLRRARDNHDWDLAVAELLTQVIIGLYCKEGDFRLDGLKRYLWELGISC